MAEARGYYGHLADARRQLRDGGDAAELVAVARVERGTFEAAARLHSRKSDRLREALLAVVDVLPYLHPNPNSPRAKVWAEWREQAINKAAAALYPEAIDISPPEGGEDDLVDIDPRGNDQFSAREGGEDG